MTVFFLVLDPPRGLPAGGGGVPRLWRYGGDSPHLHDPARAVDPRWYDLGHVISQKNRGKNDCIASWQFKKKFDVIAEDSQKR